MSNLVENTRRGIRVDEEDEIFLVRHLFYINQDGYARTNIKHKGVFLHKLLMIETSEVDHINRDKLDNRRANLRYVLHAENARNRKAHSGTASGYKGVSKHGTNWRVILMVDGRRLDLGTYVTKEEAAVIYNKNAIKYHGEFAVLNEVGC